MYKTKLNPEFWTLFRHLMFGGILILLVSVVLLQVMKKQREFIVTQSNISVVADLTLALVLSGEPLANGFGDKPASWEQLKQLAPFNEEDIKDILDQKKIHIAGHNQLVIQLPEAAQSLTISDNTIQKAIHFDNIYFQFFKSKSMNDAFKLEILKSSCCLNISNYSSSSPINDKISHVFFESKGNGFAWQLDDGTSLFIQFDYDFDHEILMIMLIICIAVIAILFMVWVKLVSLEQSLMNKGMNLSNGTGVLKELTYTYDTMSSHIQRLLKVQREMINAISHELRTPIARLRFGLEVIKDEVADADLLTISALEDDIEELNSLVDEVLTYGKLEEGSLNLHFEKVNIRKLIDGILKHNELLLSHLVITVKCNDKDSIVMADVHHLHRALQNLILNAGKYAHKNVHIIFKQCEEHWQVDIEDDGPGIAQDDREKIFIPFHRLDNSRTRASGGYGLGLAIVQRIAFWHSGSVVVNEGEIGGAKFSFTWSKCYHQQ